MSKNEPEQAVSPAESAGDGAPLASKQGFCPRCGYEFTIICSLNDTSAPCPLCQDAVALEQV